MCISATIHVFTYYMDVISDILWLKAPKSHQSIWCYHGCLDVSVIKWDYYALIMWTTKNGFKRVSSFKCDAVSCCVGSKHCLLMHLSCCQIPVIHSLSWYQYTCNYGTLVLLHSASRYRLDLASDFSLLHTWIDAFHSHQFLGHGCGYRRNIRSPQVLDS